MIRIILSSLITVLVFCGIMRPDDIRSSVDDPRTILKEYERGQSSVESYDLRIVAKHQLWIDTSGNIQNGKTVIRERRKLTQPLEKTEYFRQIMQAGRSRIETLDRHFMLKSRICVSDRARDIALVNGDPGEGVIKPRRGPVCSEGSDYRQTYLTIFERIPIFKTLEVRKSLKAEKISKYQILLTTNPEPDANVSHPKSFFRVVIEIDKSHLPSKVEEHRPSKSGTYYLDRRMEVNEWKELSRAHWVPIRATTQFYTTPDDKVPNVLNNEVELIVDQSNSRWNCQIDESMFQLEFPPGTIVTDMIRNIRYTAGKDDPGP